MSHTGHQNVGQEERKDRDLPSPGFGVTRGESAFAKRYGMTREG